MIGGSIENALAVKNNESNLIDTLDWMQQQKIHKSKLKSFKKDLMSQKQKVAQSKFGGKKCEDIDSQRALRGQNKRVTSLVTQNREKKEAMRKNLILSNKMKQIFSRRRSYYGELCVAGGSSQQIISASPTAGRGQHQNSLNRMKNAGINPHIMLNQSSGTELQQYQPNMRIQDGSPQKEDQGQPNADVAIVQNPSFDGSPGQQIKKTENENDADQQITNNELPHKTSSDNIKKGNQTVENSEMGKENQTFGNETTKKNNLTSLTPMNFNTNAKYGAADKNSIETDMNKFGVRNQKDLLMTHQAFNSGSKKDRMGGTTLDIVKKINKHNRNFNDQNSNQMLKTQTSFQSQTTYPHLYMEVQRPSILQTINAGKMADMSELTNINQLQVGNSSKMSIKRTFHERNKSLNETFRKNEQLRINQENNKILNYMKQLRPSSALQVEKLAKHYKKNETLKKRIVMTKFTKRHQTQLKQAIKIRQKVFNELPPVVSPIHKHALFRRRSSDIDIQQDGSNEGPKDDHPIKQTSHQKDAGKQVNRDLEQSNTIDNPGMLLNHDQSVQNVNGSFHKRHQSLGPAQPSKSKQVQINTQTAENYYVQDELKYLQKVDPQQISSPYNYRMDIYSQQQDYQIGQQLFQMLGNSKYHKDLDLTQFTSGQLPVDHALTPQLIQSFYTEQKVTNQDMKRRKFYGNLINQVSTRDMTPKPQVNYASSTKYNQSSRQINLNNVTSSNFRASSNSQIDGQSQSVEGPEVSQIAHNQSKPKNMSSSRNNFNTIGYNLPNITNTYGLYQQLINEESQDLKRMESYQKKQGFKIKQQAIYKREKQRLEDIKKYRIALKQQQEDLLNQTDQTFIDKSKVKVEDQNNQQNVQSDRKLDDSKMKSKSPPRIPNQNTISWVNKMRTTEITEKTKDQGRPKTFIELQLQQNQQKANKTSQGGFMQSKKSIEEKTPNSLTRQNQAVQNVPLKLNNKQEDKVLNKTANVFTNKASNSPVKTQRDLKPPVDPMKKIQIKKEVLSNISKIDNATKTTNKPEGSSKTSQILTARKPAAVKQTNQLNNGQKIKNQNVMNQTMTSLSSNVIKGTINSQNTTPNIQTGTLIKGMQQAAKSGNNTTDEEEEEDLTQRKKLIVEQPKQSKANKKPLIKPNFGGIIKEQVTNEDKQYGQQTKRAPHLNPLDEKGQETTDNYEDYNESDDTKTKQNNKKKQPPQVQMSSESSGMADSQAKNSDDYESDYFDDEAQKQQKTAHDYFKEEEARKSRDTPVGGNPNSDGGSVFNQTGGQFLNRGQLNQTKSSIYKGERENIVINQEQINQRNTNLRTQRTMNEQKEKDRSAPISQINSKGKQDFLGSALSGANHSASRYNNQFEEAQEGQFTKVLADYSISPPLIKAKEQALTGQSSKGSFISPQPIAQGSKTNMDEVGHLLPATDIKSFGTKQTDPKSSDLINLASNQANQMKKTEQSNQRYQVESETDKSEKYSDEEDFEPDMDLVQKNSQNVPIVPKRQPLENVEDDEYSDDDDQAGSLSSKEKVGLPFEKKKGSLSKYPIPKSFKEDSRENTSSSNLPINQQAEKSSKQTSKFQSPEQKKQMTANMNAQSDDEDDYSNDSFN